MQIEEVTYPNPIVVDYECTLLKFRNFQAFESSICGEAVRTGERSDHTRAVSSILPYTSHAEDMQATVAR